MDCITTLAKELYSIYVDISFENKEEPYLPTYYF